MKVTRYLPLLLIPAMSSLALADPSIAVRVLKCVESGALGTQATYDIYLKNDGQYFVTDGTELYNGSADAVSHTLTWGDSRIEPSSVPGEWRKVSPSGTLPVACN